MPAPTITEKPSRFFHAPPPHIWLQAAIIVAAGWFVYAPALHGGWVWDDRADIAGNPLLRNLDGLGKIWCEPTRLFDFYPLKYTVQWVQWQLWQNDTLGYHLTNVVLHLLGAILFWRLLRQLGLHHAWLGALWFTVHPLAVESVAWIVELKNTLSLPPLLLACSALIAFEAHGRRRDYLKALSWYTIKLLCKTSGVVLPVVLLLFLWWRRGRVGRREWLVAAPFFALSLAFGLITVWFQQHRGIAQEPINLGGPLDRLALMTSSLAHYFRTSVWPVELLPIYPRWSLAPPSAALSAAWLAGTTAITWMWTRRASWRRHVILGGGWFVLYLAPFVGVTPISYMRFSWVMDHIAYVPILGLLGLGVAAVDAAAAHMRAEWRFLPLSAGLAIAVTFAGLARHLAANFRSEETLWSYTVAHNADAWMAHNNLGALLGAKGEHAAARTHLETALRLRPDYADAHKNLADLLHTTGDLAGAQEHYERALVLNPDMVWAHVALAEMERVSGHPADAMPHLEVASRLDPENADVFNICGLAFRDLGNFDRAIESFEHAIKCRSDFPEAHVNLGSTLRQTGRTNEAIAHFGAALQMRPRSHEVRYNLGNALQALGRHEDAIRAYHQALTLKPDLAAAHYNMAVSLVALGRTVEAREHYREARRLQPSLPELTF